MQAFGNMEFKEPGIFVVKVIAVVMLFGALGRHPYAYYTLLRWVVCGVAAYAAFRTLETGKTGWVWILGFVALLFNPVLPVHLNREIWIFVDVAVAVMLLISIVVVDRHPHQPDRNAHGPLDRERVE